MILCVRRWRFGFSSLVNYVDRPALPMIIASLAMIIVFQATGPSPASTAY